MSGDNPFSEPDDSDRTVIRPAPGGRRAAPPPSAAAPAAPPPGAAAAVTGGAERIEGTGEPLLAAAAPLLQLLARLRNTLSAPDPGDLRERAVREMRTFEATAREAKVPLEQLRPAHYALCASLDDVVLATPWGSQGAWNTRSLISSFHQEVRSGERFFDLLGQVKQNPGLMLPVLELMYLCLSLGFMGRYRLSPRGPAEIDRLREELYGIIARQRTEAAGELSPRWRGVNAAYRPARARLPLWVAVVAVLAVLGGMFVWFSRTLNAGSDALFTAMMAAPPATMPAITRAAPVVAPPPPPPALVPTALDSLRGFLAPEIARHQVEVLGTPSTPIIRINNNNLFASGSATLEAASRPLLARVGAALNTETGKVLVVGYTDDQPIHTVQFPSNYQLSKARADAALAVLARSVKTPARLQAEGRASADPVASNATAAGRAQNRRIEIVLEHGVQ